MLECIGEHHLWVHLYFSSSGQYILLVKLSCFVRWEVCNRTSTVLLGAASRSCSIAKNFLHIPCVWIYIFFNPQTDCFVVSHLFSVLRHKWCFQQGSKLYISQISYLRAIVIFSVSEGIFSYIFLHIRYRVLGCSFQENCFCIYAYVAASNSLLEFQITGVAYVLSSTERLFRCITTLQCARQARCFKLRTKSG